MWHGMVCHVCMTCECCSQNVSIKHKLGGGYTRQGETTGAFGELQERSINITEGYGYLALKVPSGEGQIPVYVRGISGRPDAILRLCER